MHKLLGLLAFLVVSLPVYAEKAPQEIQEIKKKKTDLFTEYQRLLLEGEILNRNLRDLTELREEKKKLIDHHQKEVSTKLPILVRLGRSNPLRFLVEPSQGQNTLRGLTLLRTLTTSLKLQAQKVQTELSEITALSKEFENKFQAHNKLLQTIALQRAQLIALESEHIENFKKKELNRLAKEEDINTLLDESRETLSKKERANATATKAKKLPFRRLERPVAGKIIEDSKLQNKFSPHSQGIIFEAKKNAEVSAPSKGKVVFKGPFRNQGDILMLDHGQKVFTILMGMHKINAQVGQKVYAGEKLGVMAGYGASSPKLYLELRQKGKAIDPRPYFAD